MNIFPRWLKGAPEQATTEGAGCPTVDEILLDLAKFGGPTITTTSNGWWCYLSIRREGVELVVKSESNHKTPFSAALQCADRLSDIQAWKRS